MARMGLPNIQGRLFGLLLKGSTMCALYSAMEAIDRNWQFCSGYHGK